LRLFFGGVRQETAGHGFDQRLQELLQISQRHLKIRSPLSKGMTRKIFTIQTSNPQQFFPLGISLRRNRHRPILLELGS